jgi:hypothetical protein
LVAGWWSASPGSEPEETVAFVVLERRKLMKKVGGHSVRSVVIFGLILFLAGCGGEGGQALLDLVPLELDLVAEYGVAGIAVGLQDGSTLGVTMVDGASGSMASDGRAERARAVAEFVCEHYRSMDSIDTIEVAFEIRRDGFLSDDSGSITFAFEVAEIACGGT